MANVKPELGMVGSYDLVKVVGRGGMGIVYQAHDPKLDRVIALKMIRSDTPITKTEIDRFHLEATLVAKLNHPFIVRIYETGIHQGCPYFTMEYVDGKSLSEYLRQTMPDVSTATSIILKCCEAISHAHEHGVIHRDLKPSNVLLDDTVTPRIVDFGLAKRLCDEQNLTLSGQAIGTPNYMPPEQALGRRDLIGTASDVYGLGGILYTMLTGEPPIIADPRGTKNLLQRIVDVLPTPPRRINSDVDSDLDAICLKCLEKRPNDRYANATELNVELRRYVNGNSISARRNSYARIARHWMRRPGRIAQSATVVLVIAAFFGLTFFMGLSILLFRLMDIDAPREFALIVSLDAFGLCSCLPISLGMFARKRWSMWLGTAVGIGMTMIVAALIATGFDAGGVLADAFRRLSMYTIFAFVGILMTGASIIAWVAHCSENAAPASSTRQQIEPESTILAESTP